MPIGVVSDDEFEEELARLNRTRTPKESHVKESPGRKEGDVNVPESLRKIIGEESVINGRQSALGIAREFGISPSSVSAYAKGATSTKTYDTPNKSLISHINRSKIRASKKAGQVLSAALSAISQEKLDYTDAKDLSAIAKNMSAVIKDLEPRQEVESNNKQSPQFVIFAPQFRTEESFEVIDVKE